MFQKKYQLLTNSRVRLLGQVENSSCFAPTKLIPVVTINEVKFLRSQWKINNLNLNIWRSDTSLLDLQTKCSPNVIIKDSTFGILMFENILNITAINCNQGSENDTERFALKFFSCNVLLQNVKIHQVGQGNNSLITIGNSNVAIRRSTFKENEASIMSVFNNSSVVVENSTFQENSETMDGSNLLIDSSSMKIINTLFENNSAVQGTIYVWNDGSITIDNCTFEHNKNGAVVLEANSSAYISNSRFYNNYSSVFGGAVNAARFCSVTLLNSVFSGNLANIAGGAVSIYDNSFATISKVNFTLNEAKVWGSAIFVGQSSTVVSHSCIFDENKAGNDEYGGAATAVTWDSGIILIGATFLQNTGLESSCIVSLAGSTVVIDNCSFKENAPTVVLSIENTFTNITNSKFFNNSSPDGAILCLENCGMYVTHTEFHQNTGLDVGAGAILIHYFSRLTTFSTVFVENRANYYGAAIYVSEFSTLSSENFSFKENIAGDETHAGGTIRVENFSILELSNATFILNKGKSTSCVSSYWNCQLFVADSTFNNNNGSAFGIVNNNYLEITGSVFSNNTAPAFGGAIFSSDNSTIHIDNVTFHKNMANTGGAIAIFNSKMTIINGNFILNMAETGGGIRMERNTEVDLDHCLFLENMATLNGGGVLVNDHSSLNIIESEFRLNSAGNSGSAVYARNVCIPSCGRE